MCETKQIFTSQAWALTTSPTAPFPARIVEADSVRFWAQVEQKGECWEFGRGASAGYRSFAVSNGRRRGNTWFSVSIRAHRFALYDTGRREPPGTVPDHLCNNPRCVRPDHLEWVTHGENIRRGHERKRQKRMSP